MARWLSDLTRGGLDVTEADGSRQWSEVVGKDALGAEIEAIVKEASDKQR